MSAIPKISDEAASLIRASKEPLGVLAARYDVTKSAICQVRNGTSRLPRTRLVDVPLCEQTEEQLFATEKKRAAVRPEQIAAIIARVPTSVFDLGRVL